jgi:diguanylate cyclase (GGDEF)-like protein/PAS domain S-box-containing protein
MEEKRNVLQEENINLIEELKKYKTKNERIEHKYRTVMEIGKTIVTEWDIKADVAYWDKFNSINYSSKEATTDNAFEKWKSTIHKLDIEEVVEKLNSYLNKSCEALDIIYRHKSYNGDYKWVRMQGKATWDESNNPVHMLAVHTDISEQKMYEEKINHLAYYDSVTGFINRNLFEYKLKVDIDINKEEEHKFNTVLICIDVDNFKAINDSKSHAFGDLVLKKVGEVITALIPKGTTIARLGGDEFVILFSKIYDLEDINKVIKNIRKGFHNPLNVDGHDITLSVSMGVAMYPNDANDEKDLIKNADTALYFSKKKSKNNYEFYSVDMNSSIVENVNLENDLRNAVRNKEFVVFYQPQYSIKTGDIIGMEALVRWVHPQKGIVSPLTFIYALEEIGLIIPVGEFVMNEACRLNKELQDKGYKCTPISVNLSARQFNQKGLVNKIEKILKNTGLEPKWLILEITESIAMQDIDYTIKILHQLRSMGIKVALDDFGTGYSSLNYLKDLPIDIIKIDKTFMDGIATCTKVEAIAKAIIKLAHILNFDIVAEGVENEKQLEFLKIENCDKVQGYIYSKPIPTGEVEKKFAG